MHTYLRAIGFRECKNRQQLEDIYRHTLNTPNRKIMTTISVDTSLLQFEKDFGKNFGLSLVGEYDIKGSLSIEHYFPYYVYPDCDNRRQFHSNVLRHAEDDQK